jgi:hypothetical protein
MAPARSAALGVFVATVGLLCGCGGGSSRHAASNSKPSAATANPGTAANRGTAANPSAVAVIRGWADALRNGHLRAAARYFATPSLLVNGTDAAGHPLALEIRSPREAELANASLPCGATLVSTSRRGHYINALFRLSGRPGPGGSNCAGGVGTTARTDFVIAHGRIVQWIRAADDPGDNGSPRTAPATPAPTPPTPTSPTQPPPQTPPNGGPAV